MRSPGTHRDRRAGMVRTLHLLHVLPTFGIGGTQLRLVTLMNALGAGFTHSVIPLNGDTEAAERLDPRVPLRLLAAPPGKGGWLYIRALRRAIRGVAPDLLLTYNWGAIEAALGASLGALCPAIHNECGFGPDEAAGLKWRRVVARRLVLNRIYGTIVVSSTLRAIALRQYRVRPDRLHLIRNGVDTERFRPGHNREWRARMGVPEEALLFGFTGGLRGEKNLALLLRAFAAAGLPDARLALVGDGTDRGALEELARGLGIGDRLILTGTVPDTAPYLNAFDVFVMSSITEQTPNALLEAMACGLPAVCTGVGDAAEILGGGGRPSVVPPNDLAAYVESLATLAHQPDVRQALGTANRARCVSEYSLGRMVREYAALYRAAAKPDDY